MPIAIRADVPARMLLVDCRCGNSKVQPGQLCLACQNNAGVNRSNSTSRVISHQAVRDDIARRTYGE